MSDCVLSPLKLASCPFDCLDALRKHVECPICLEIPRDGVMLQCVNGHNVCATCKGKLGRGLCPQGRCGYHHSPTRNRTVADLVDSFPFEHSCKYSKNAYSSRCEFKATRSLLESHEETCEHRTAPCPCSPCTDVVNKSSVLEHCTTVHRLKTYDCGRESADIDSFGFRRLWKGEWSETTPEDLIWDEAAYFLKSSWMLACCHLERGHVYVWLQVIAGGNENENLKCEISLGEGMTRSKSLTAPVYSIERTSDEIIQDEGCARFSVDSVKAVLTEIGVNEGHRRDGYSYCFPVKFRVVKRDDSPREIDDSTMEIDDSPREVLSLSTL